MRLVTNRGQPGLHSVLHGQVQLAFRVVKFALLADQVSLRLLGFGQLGVALPEHLVEVDDFLCPSVQIGLDKALGLQGLSDGDLAAFLVEPRSHFGVDLLPRRGQLALAGARMAASRAATSASFWASWLSYRLRVSAISGAARDSVSLISVRQAWAGQGWVGH